MKSKNKFRSAVVAHMKNLQVFFIVAFILILIFGIVFIQYTWKSEKIDNSIFIKATEEIFTVAGLDYPVEIWNEDAVTEILKSVLIVVFLMIILICSYVLLKQNIILNESERSKTVLLNNLPGMAYRCNYDPDWTMQFVSDGCYELTGYKPESLLNNKEISFNALIEPKYQEYLWNQWMIVIQSKSKLKEEYEIITASGEIKWVFEQGQGIYDPNDAIIALEGLIIDITDRKKKEERIVYISEHDDMTGLYNRRFFENEMERMDSEGYLPISLVIGDINGVKLINDAFGHTEGDKLIIQTARILEACCRENDILARTSGDEFRILLPNTENQKANELLKKIKRACEEYNNNTDDVALLKLSLGCGTKALVEETIDAVEKEAEDAMYKQKLLEQRSSHSSIISSIRATMFEKSQETEEHAQRLVRLSKVIGTALQLSQKELDKLELFAMLHDLGKIGIDDQILNKPEKLTEDEWNVMKKHPEIGYRIAMSAPELEQIAEYILTHHERWDGQGYPQGLKGEAIPLGSRIVAVADSFDAMISDRPYRKAMSIQDAIIEIVQNSGTQFDPAIVNVFVVNVVPGDEIDWITI